MKIVLTIGGALARLLSAVLHRWELVLIAVFLISPVGPHLRLQYDFYGSYSNPYRLENCLYVGSRGLITPDYGYLDDCPVVAWIDTREAVR